MIEQLRDATGRGVLCNRPYSGTAVIDDFGEEHLRTGDLIVYTSADSVLQIAAHDDEVPQAELYAACQAAREIMRGEHAVGRVIARPFRGEPGAFERTEGRKDFALDPPGRSYLDELQADGIPVHTVGKIGSVFNHVGVDHEHPGATNPAAIAATTRADATSSSTASCSRTSSRPTRSTATARTCRASTARCGRSTPRWGSGSRGSTPSATCSCSPPTTAATRRRPGTDHTREHVPLLAAFAGHGGRRHDGPFADVGASVLRWLAGRDADGLPGTPFT